MYLLFHLFSIVPFPLRSASQSDALTIFAAECELLEHLLRTVHRTQTEAGNQ